MLRAVLPIAYLALLAYGALTIPLWWDEGWNILPAVNYARHGHYGAFFGSQPVVVPLSGTILTTSPAIFAARFLGEAAWQLRLPYVLITISALCIYFRLLCRVWDRRIATSSLALMLLAGWHRHLNPALLGSQILAEFIGFGFLCLLLHCVYSAVERGNSAWFYVAGVCLALTAFAKMQFVLFAPILILAIVYWLLRAGFRKEAIHCVLGCVLALALWNGLWSFEHMIRPRAGTELAPAIAHHWDVIFSRDAERREIALFFVMQSAMPVLLGLMFAVGFLEFDTTAQGREAAARKVIAFGMLVFSALWLSWYSIFSVGYARYLAYAVYIGIPFFPVSVQHLWRLRNASGDARLCRRVILRCAPGLLMAVAGVNVWNTIYGLSLIPATTADGDIQVVHDYLRSELSADAVVATNESELLYRLPCSYRFPPEFFSLESTPVSEQRAVLLHDYLRGVLPDVIVRSEIGPGVGAFPQVEKLFDFRKVKELGRFTVYRHN